MLLSLISQSVLLCFQCVRLIEFRMSLPHGTMMDLSVIMLYPGHTHWLFWSEWESDLRSSTPQSKTLISRQRRFLYLVVFCVSSLWYHVELVCDYGISWSYSLAVLVRVGFRPAICHTSVKDSIHLATALLTSSSVLCLFLMVPCWIGL